MIVRQEHRQNSQKFIYFAFYQLKQCQKARKREPSGDKSAQFTLSCFLFVFDSLKFNVTFKLKIRKFRRPSECR